MPGFDDENRGPGNRGEQRGIGKSQHRGPVDKDEVEAFRGQAHQFRHPLAGQQFHRIWRQRTAGDDEQTFMLGRQGNLGGPESGDKIIREALVVRDIE